MKKIGWIICRTWIEKRAKGSKAALISFLPPIQREQITTLTPPSSDVSLGFNLIDTVFKWSHPSWFAPFLRTLSEGDAILFISALEQKSAEFLQTTLKLSSPLHSLSPLCLDFFKKKLVHSILPPALDLIPLEGLPTSNLQQLIALSSHELKLLVEFLGLHDLAIEMKQIIDNTKLKMIYSTLSPSKELYLKMLTHKKEPVVFKRIEISHWDGKKETLLNLLYQRGLNRLAKAVYPEDSSFIWYVKHRMDLEEAHLFSAFLKGLDHANAYNILSRQVLEAITFLQKINPRSNI